MNRILLYAALVVASVATSPVLYSQQPKTIHNMQCAMTVPADWIQRGSASAHAPEPKTSVAFVRLIVPDDAKMMREAIKNGSMANVKARIVDDNDRRLVVQMQPIGLNGKPMNRLQLMTKGNPGCQGRVDFEDPSDVSAARKIVDTTTGAN